MSLVCVCDFVNVSGGLSLNRNDLPALSASHVKTTVILRCHMLILKANLLCFRGLSAGTAHLYLTLVYPALVSRCIFYTLWGVHLVIEFQLLHESFIRLTERSTLSDLL